MDSNTTKEQILDSAYDLFVSQGYHGCSMREIARKTDIQVGSIYNHFAGKEEIFEAVFARHNPMYKILEILNQIEGSSGKELITNAIRELRKQMQSDSGILALYFIELVELDGKHVSDAISTNFPFITQFLKKLYKRESRIRDMKPHVLLRSLIAFTLSYVMFEWFMGVKASEKWGSLEELTDVYMYGVLKE